MSETKFKNWLAKWIAFGIPDEIVLQGTHALRAFREARMNKGTGAEETSVKNLTHYVEVFRLTWKIYREKR